jgi:hypothetical protein
MMPRGPRGSLSALSGPEDNGSIAAPPRSKDRRLSGPRGGRPSPLGVVPALLLVVIATWEVCATPRDASSVPDDGAWEKASAVVRAGYQPGDLIVFAPAWNDPVGRLHLGDLIPVDMAARMDAARYGRIWEVSIRGARAKETAGLAPQEIITGHGITIRFFSREPTPVLADLRDAVAAVKVEGGARPSLELAEVGFEPHRCLQIVPAPGRPVRMTFPQVLLGGKLVGYVGLADVFTRRNIRAPGKLAVEIGGREVARATPGVDDGWVRFEAATTPGLADVTFVASADAPQRLICFAAESRP